MSAQSGELTVTYKIVLPPSTVTPQFLSPDTIHRFPIAGPPEDSKGDAELKKYYASLRSSIAEARTKLGEELTAWRDAVGNAEIEREKSAKSEVDDEGEEENTEE